MARTKQLTSRRPRSGQPPRAAGIEDATMNDAAVHGAGAAARDALDAHAAAEGGGSRGGRPAKHPHLKGILDATHPWNKLPVGENGEEEEWPEPEG